MRIVLTIVALLVVVIAVAAIGIRRLEHDPGAWHVDPLTAPSPSTPNWYRIAPASAGIVDAVEAPEFAMSAAELAAAFDRVARADDRVEVVGGSPSDGFVTYVQASAVFGFPDYISARFVTLDGDRSTLAVLSRSRLGKSDLGVNQKRIERWLAELN